VHCPAFLRMIGIKTRKRFEEKGGEEDAESDQMRLEELQDKVLIGVFVDKELPVYQDEYEKIRERAKGEAGR
jgi:hypothetical protein